MEEKEDCNHRKKELIYTNSRFHSDFFSSSFLRSFLSFSFLPSFLPLTDCGRKDFTPTADTHAKRIKYCAILFPKQIRKRKEKGRMKEVEKRSKRMEKCVTADKEKSKSTRRKNRFESPRPDTFE